MQVNNASRGIRLRRLVPPGDKILEEQKKREEEERKKRGEEERKKKEEEEEKSRDLEKRKEVAAALAAAQVKVRALGLNVLSLVPHIPSYQQLFIHAHYLPSV